MAKLVYIEQICTESWLHWSWRGQSSRLRDFRGKEPHVYRDYSTMRIRQLLANNTWPEKPAPRIPVTDVVAWRDEIVLLNIDYGLISSPKSQRLLKVFIDQATKILKTGNANRLKSEFNRWKTKFACIKNKTEFNHWDHDDASLKMSINKGIGWTAIMLEHCRQRKKFQHIQTGKKPLDFAMLSMELNLGISSKNNKFQRGKTDFIKPDGLGVRRDNSFCVIEVKGPQDDDDLLKATLQAVCGALAVYAKRKMIVQIARNGARRRPPIKNRGIPKGRPSLSVYVIMSSKTPRKHEMFQSKNIPYHYCKMILSAFPQLKEFVYFSVNARQPNDLTNFHGHTCITVP